MKSKPVPMDGDLLFWLLSSSIQMHSVLEDSGLRYFLIIFSKYIIIKRFTRILL